MSIKIKNLFICCAFLFPVLGMASETLPEQHETASDRTAREIQVLKEFSSTYCDAEGNEWELTLRPLVITLHKDAPASWEPFLREIADLDQRKNWEEICVRLKEMDDRLGGIDSLSKYPREFLRFLDDAWNDMRTETYFRMFESHILVSENDCFISDIFFDCQDHVRSVLNFRKKGEAGDSVISLKGALLDTVGIYINRLYYFLRHFEGYQYTSFDSRVFSNIRFDYENGSLSQKQYLSWALVSALNDPETVAYYES